MVFFGLKKGQMIVEALIAFSISMIALVALLELSNRSSATSGLSSRSAQASAYADEGINWVKQQRDNMNWSDFLSKSSSSGLAYCLISSPFSFTVGACNPTGNEITGTVFTRNLIMKKIASGSDNYVEADITVTWTEGSRPEKIYRNIEFYHHN